MKIKSDNNPTRLRDNIIALAAATAAVLGGKAMLESEANSERPAPDFAEKTDIPNIDLSQSFLSNSQQIPVPMEVSKIVSQWLELAADTTLGGESSISAKWLHEKLRDPALGSDEAVAISALFLARDPLRHMADSDPNSLDIPVNALASFCSKHQALFSLGAIEFDGIQSFLQHELWPAVDQDRNSEISAAELKEFLRLTNIPEQARAGAGELLRRLESEEMNEFNADGALTQEELKSIRALILKSPEFAIIKSVMESIRRSENLHDFTTDLYRTPDNPLNSIQAEAIEQGKIGNCYFLASLASLAAQSPETILGFIGSPTDSGYQISFPGALDRAGQAVVSEGREPSPCLSIISTSTTQGAWVGVLEDAFSSYRIEHSNNSSTELAEGRLSLEYSSSGSPQEALQILSGGEVRAETIRNFSRAEFRAMIAEIHEGQRPAVFGTINPNTEPAESFGFAAAHAYAILDTTELGNSDFSIRVLNPWNNGLGAGGEMTLSTDAAYDLFTNIYYCVSDRNS